MNIRRLLGLAAAAFLFVAGPASANVINMCQGDVSGASTGSRTIGGTLSAVPSGTTYILNGAGCANILAQDVGYFLSQGYTMSGGLPAIQFVVPVTATGTTSYQIGTLPANAAITGIYNSNTDASHAVTGGIALGTTSGGTDIAAAATNTSLTSSVFALTDALTLKKVFSTTAGQAIFATAGTSWNTPTTVTITITYAYF